MRRLLTKPGSLSGLERDRLRMSERSTHCELIVSAPLAHTQPVSFAAAIREDVEGDSGHLTWSQKSRPSFETLPCTRKSGYWQISRYRTDISGVHLRDAHVSALTDSEYRVKMDMGFVRNYKISKIPGGSRAGPSSLPLISLSLTFSLTGNWYTPCSSSASTQGRNFFVS